jgi:hypothetical protein
MENPVRDGADSVLGRRAGVKEKTLKRFLIAAGVVCFGAAFAQAQSMEDLNVQAHGFATQSLIYSTHNNWDTTNSTAGSTAWTEAVLNVTAQPDPKLRIGMQGRFFLLGDYGNQITLDWALADYKVNELVGFRVGKVKSPTGLLNEIQDVDPSYLWILLPQSVYPISSRNTILAHYGGVVYGTVPLGERLGKLHYRAYGGERVIGPDDGFLYDYEHSGETFPDGLKGRAFGGTLLWDAPLKGLQVGATETSEEPKGTVVVGPLWGKVGSVPFTSPYFFARYERNKVMVAGEYKRLPVNENVTFPGIPVVDDARDQRSFYGMASYRFTGKLAGGMYYSSSTDRKVPLGSSRYQKDWALAVRYDIGPYLYAKAEQHFIDGTEIGYSMTNNTNGLKANDRMTMLKVGVSF